MLNTLLSHFKENTKKQTLLQNKSEENESMLYDAGLWNQPGKKESYKLLAQQNMQNAKQKRVGVWETLFYSAAWNASQFFLPTLKTKQNKKRISKRTHEHYYFRVNFLFFIYNKEKL